MNLVEQAERLDEIFSDETKWCKGTCFMSAGKVVFTPEKATSFCLRGAVYVINGFPGFIDNLPLYQMIKDAIIKRTSRRTAGFVAYNDDAATTFEDIRAVVEMVKQMAYEIETEVTEPIQVLEDA